MSELFPPGSNPAVLSAAQKAAYIHTGAEVLSCIYNPEDAYIFANDRKYEAAFSTALQHMPEAGKATRVGLIVGTGFLFSSTPELRSNVDMVVVADNNGLIHDWIDDSTKVFASVSTPKQYLSRFWHPSQNLAQQIYMGLPKELRNTHTIANWLADERVSAGDYHFLQDSGRFALCKEATLELPRASATVDFRRQQDMQTLATLLRETNSVITFANLTNVWEHVHGGQPDTKTNAEVEAQHRRNLSLLPFADDAAIIHSSLTPVNSEIAVPLSQQGYPEARFCQGLNTYMDQAHVEYELLMARGLVQRTLQEEFE